MRIRKITFSNINNLKGGPHIVDFSNEPLASSGIFAIVGPTGSGKSTLLDVITLALFNEVPRHGKLSKNSIIDSGSIVTHNAKNAYARVEFEVKNQIFTSSWEIESTKKGNLKDYHMSISDASGSFLDLKRSEVPGKNMELIGLNYDQFVKSIILSQGDFSRFLKAKKEERSELLEKLTGTEIYRDISKAAFQKNKEVSQALNNERLVLEEINLLTESDLAELRQQSTEKEERSILIDKSVENLLKSKTIKERLLSISEDLGSRKIALKDLRQTIELYKPKLRKLDDHNKVKTHEGAILLLEEAENTVKQTENDLSRLLVSYSKAEDNQSQVVDRLSELLTAKVSVDDFENQMSTYELQVNELDQQMRDLEVIGKQSRNELSNALLDIDLNLSPTSDPEMALPILEKEVAELSAKKGRQAISDVDYQQSIKKKRGDLAVLQSLVYRQKNLNEIRIEIVSLKDQEAKEIEKLKTSEPLVGQQKKLVVNLHSQLDLLRKGREDAIKIAKLETLRDQLVAGEACPLCGSTEHPYTEHLDAKGLSIIDEDLQTCKDELKLQEANLQKYLDDHKSRKQTISSIVERRQKLLERRLLEENSQEDEKKKLQESLYQETDLIKAASTLEADIVAFESAFAASRKLKSVKHLIKIFEELKDVRATYLKLRSERQRLYDGNDFTGEMGALKKSFVNSSSTMKNLDEVIEKRKEALDISKAKLKTSLAKMDSVLRNLGLSNIEALKSLLLSEEEAKEIEEKGIRLREAKIKMETEIDQLAKEYEVLIVKDSGKSHSLEEINEEIRVKTIERDLIKEQIGEIKSRLKMDSNNRERQTSRRAMIEKLEKESKKWSLMNKMIGSSKGDSFANFAQELTLKNLLAFANRRLRDLTDRYLLDMPKDGGPLVVIDLYQGNTERSVTTLSGGEIFILSLALALSLSDMASKNIALDSLFIDEGFGTLDQETLDIAMTTLEKLQSDSKKTVGIISHVEALKERISVQIRLEKNAQGYSKIKVSS